MGVFLDLVELVLPTSVINSFREESAGTALFFVAQYDKLNSKCPIDSCPEER